MILPLQHLLTLIIIYLSELNLSLNNSASELRQWADSNKLPINESKAKVLTNTRKCLAPKINDELVVTVEDNRLVNVKLVIRF